MLKAAAEQPGSHVVHSLYAMALIDAEGGHYQEVGGCSSGRTQKSLLLRSLHLLLVSPSSIPWLVHMQPQQEQ